MDLLSPVKSFFEFTIPIIDNVPVIRAALGFVLVFFVPGFAWTLVFFKQLHYLERIVLSIGLSIALVTLTIILANGLFKVRITGLNSLLSIIVITVIPLAIYYVSRYIRRKKGKTQQVDDSGNTE